MHVYFYEHDMHLLSFNFLYFIIMYTATEVHKFFGFNHFRLVSGTF